jgi:hypothetical protein
MQFLHCGNDFLPAIPFRTDRSWNAERCIVPVPRWLWIGAYMIVQKLFCSPCSEFESIYVWICPNAFCFGMTGENDLPCRKSISITASMSDRQAAVFQTFIHPSTFMYVWPLQSDFIKNWRRPYLQNHPIITLKKQTIINLKRKNNFVNADIILSLKKRWHHLVAGSSKIREPE